MRVVMFWSKKRSTVTFLVQMNKEEKKKMSPFGANEDGDEDYEDENAEEGSNDDGNGNAPWQLERWLQLSPTLAGSRGRSAKVFLWWW